MEIAIMVGLSAIITVVVIGVICIRVDTSADRHDLKTR